MNAKCVCIVFVSGDCIRLLFLPFLFLFFCKHIVSLVLAHKILCTVQNDLDCGGFVRRFCQFLTRESKFVRRSSHKSARIGGVTFSYIAGAPPVGRFVRRFFSQIR